jgi:hypothetical protein
MGYGEQRRLRYRSSWRLTKGGARQQLVNLPIDKNLTIVNVAKKSFYLKTFVGGNPF